MAEQRLDLPHVVAGLEQVRREAVSTRVRRDPLADLTPLIGGGSNPLEDVARRAANRAPIPTERDAPPRASTDKRRGRADPPPERGKPTRERAGKTRERAE